MCASHHSARSGFTLIETIVAIILLATALLALEGAAAATMRELAYGGREATGSRVAEQQRERAFAACAASSGVDSSNGVVVTWSASTLAPLATVVQSTSFPTSAGWRTESYHVVGRCR